MKATRIRKPVKSKPEKSPALTQELPDRLAELEVELRRYTSSPSVERPLTSVHEPKDTVIGAEKVVQFTLDKKIYAAGHSNLTYAGSNHARGIRHIRFYADGKTVLDIEGDFEDQMFGSNFRFQNIDLYVPGDWEKDFIKLTDEFRLYKAKRRNAFSKKRQVERSRLRRRGSI